MASIASIFLAPEGIFLKVTFFDLPSQSGPKVQIEPGKQYVALLSGFESHPRKLGKVSG
jgi:hypothetical protein